MCFEEVGRKLVGLRGVGERRWVYGGCVRVLRCGRTLDGYCIDAVTADCLVEVVVFVVVGWRRDVGSFC